MAAGWRGSANLSRPLGMLLTEQELSNSPGLYSPSQSLHLRSSPSLFLSPSLFRFPFSLRLALSTPTRFYSLGSTAVRWLSDCFFALVAFFFWFRAPAAPLAVSVAKTTSALLPLQLCFFLILYPSLYPLSASPSLLSAAFRILSFCCCCCCCCARSPFSGESGSSDVFSWNANGIIFI